MPNNLRNSLIESDEHEALARFARSNHANKFIGHYIHNLKP